MLRKVVFGDWGWGGGLSPRNVIVSILVFYMTRDRRENSSLPVLMDSHENYVEFSAPFVAREGLVECNYTQRDEDAAAAAASTLKEGARDPSPIGH